MPRSLALAVLTLITTLSALAQPADLRVEAAALVPDALEVRDVEVSRFASYLAIYDLSEINTIRLFSAELDQQWKHQLSHYWAGSLPAGSVLAFSPDEQLLFFPGYRTDTDVCVCETATGEPQQVLLGHEDDVTNLALSPDGLHLVTISSSEIVLWEQSLNGYRELARINGYAPTTQSVAFLPNSTQFVTTSRNDRRRSLTLFSIAEGSPVAIDEYSLQDNNVSYDFRHLAVSPDGEWVAAGYRDDLHFFQIDGKALVHVQSAEGIELGTVSTVAASPDGRYFVSGHFGYLRWWQFDGSRWTAVATTATQQPATMDLAFESAGSRLLLASAATENALASYLLEGVEPSASGMIARALTGPLSAEQRSVLTPDAAGQIVSAVGPDRFAARDMFETSAEYASRLSALQHDLQQSLVLRIEQQFGIERRATGPTGYEIAMPLVAQGSYDVDSGRYELGILQSSAWVQLPRDPARDLYRNWEQARVLATVSEGAGTLSVDDFRLVHPTSGTEYPLVIDQDPFTGAAMNTARFVVPSVPIGPDLLIRELEVDAIFPAIRYSYANRPIGRFVLENAGSGIVGNVSLVFTLEGLTTPTAVEIPRSIAAGRQVSAELTTVMGSAIDQFPQGGSTELRIEVSYERAGRGYQEIFSRQIRILSQNAIQWSEDEKVAAFVDAGSPRLIELATHVTSSTQLTATPILTRNILSAVELFSALRARGLTYVVDPNSAYEALSEDLLSVDYVRFPLQTLAAGGGDCDDLSVLYAALLEASGVSTAFITTPGHIFLAFDSGISPADAESLFESPESYIVRDGTVWLPVESTAVAQGFVRAWQTGSVQWTQAQNAGTAYFFPTRTAWNQYEPSPQPVVEVNPVDPARVHALADGELTRYRELELDPKLRALDPAQNSPVARTRRGALLAAYGLFDEARTEFLNATREQAHVPALINLANISSLTGKAGEAQNYLEQAVDIEPDNARILMGLAFLYLQSGDREVAESTYSEASRISPALARRFPLFAGDGGDGTRASAGTDLFSLDWASDE